MDFETAFNSTSIKQQSSAAIFLRAEGSDGVHHLPALLRCCQTLDIHASVLDPFQESLLGYGAITMGDIIGKIGFDEHNSLHLAILNWLIELTTVSAINVVGHSIYGLGYLGSTHSKALDCLHEIVSSERRPNDYPIVTLRAVAFRMLARIDHNLAAEFRNSPACAEYLDCIKHWRTQRDYPELDAEVEWLL